MCDSLCTTSVLLAASFQLRSLSNFQKFIAIQIFIWIYEFFENHPQRRVFCNVNFRNLQNVLQRNLTTDGEWVHFKIIWRQVFSWVGCTYRSARKHSGYVTGVLQYYFTIWFVCTSVRSCLKFLVLATDIE